LPKDYGKFIAAIHKGIGIKKRGVICYYGAMKIICPSILRDKGIVGSKKPYLCAQKNVLNTLEEIELSEGLHISYHRWGL